MCSCLIRMGSIEPTESFLRSLVSDWLINSLGKGIGVEKLFWGV
jgi:hypothetical protein